MSYSANTPTGYLASLPDDRKAAVGKMRDAILSNLPAEFNETMSYGMIGYVVPHEVYPPGYHCDPKLPLPFMSIASQKNYVALYHMGLYVSPELLDWFAQEYAKRMPTKLDMGKSCIRFKKMDQIPFGLIGELTAKMTAQDWIELYEQKVKR